jgi:hypothetical protein
MIFVTAYKSMNGSCERWRILFLYIFAFLSHYLFYLRNCLYFFANRHKLSPSLRTENKNSMSILQGKEYWYFYHLILTDREGNFQYDRGQIANYKGVTNNLCHRLRAENRIVSGGAKTCLRFLGPKNKPKEHLVWKHMYFIGPFEAATAHSFEAYTKGKCEKRRRGLCMNLQEIRNAHLPLPSSIIDVLETLNMSYFQDLNLNIYWGEKLIPYNSLIPLLPRTISIREISIEEKKELLHVSQNQTPWKVLPY